MLLIPQKGKNLVLNSAQVPPIFKVWNSGFSLQKDYDDPLTWVLIVLDQIGAPFPLNFETNCFLEMN